MEACDGAQVSKQPMSGASADKFGEDVFGGHARAEAADGVETSGAHASTSDSFGANVADSASASSAGGAREAGLDAARDTATESGHGARISRKSSAQIREPQSTSEWVLRVAEIGETVDASVRANGERYQPRRSRHNLPCCLRRYSVARLRNSLVMTLLNVFHAYNLFAATVVGFALGVNLLISWFIEWFQYSAGRQDGLSALPLGKFLAVVFRSCMLIQLLCQLLRASIWLVQDALRLDSFQLYRCFLLGCGIKKLKSGQTDALSHLGAPGGWSYQHEDQVYYDIWVQVFIYSAFDLVPIAAAVWTFASTRDMEDAFSTFGIYVCGAAIVHVLVFHSATVVNDIAAKGLAWCEFWAETRSLRVDSAGSLLLGVVDGQTTDRVSPLVSRNSRTSMEADQSSEASEELEAPWNICALMCGLFEALGKVLLQAAAAACIFLFCLWRWLSHNDIIPMVALLVATVGGTCLWCIRRCSLKASEHAPQRPPRDWPRVRRFWKRLQAAQRWADVHCGLAESHAAAQYDVFAFVVILQVGLFWYVRWWTGMFAMALILSLAVLRRLTLELSKPFSWVVGFFEAFALVGSSVALNYKYFDCWYALGTFVLCLGVQFTLSRQHAQKWRYFIWVSFVLQLALTMIMAVSMLMLIQEDEHYTNFCHPAEPDCQYFSTGSIMPPTIANKYGFCDMRFSLLRPEHPHDYGDRFSPAGCSSKPGHCLSLQQFAMLSALAYESNETFNSSLERWFPAPRGTNGWRVVDERRVGRISARGGLHKDWTTFIELSDPHNETTVFVIRGTQTPLEIMQDMNIWSPIAIAQLAGLIGPDLSATAARSVLVFSTVIYGQWMQKHYYADFLGTVRKKLAADPNRRYYLTGHSLGGGLAKLVSAETNVTSVTFSSPGIRATSLLLADVKQQEGVERLHRLSYTVVPDNDIVPRVDKQVGTTFHIGCRESPLNCHSIGRTLCELINHCGGIGGAEVGFPVPVACPLCPARSEAFPGCRKPGGSVSGSLFLA